MDTFARVPAKSLARLHMDPEGGAPFASGLGDAVVVPDAAVDAFIAEAGPTPRLAADGRARQLGGAWAARTRAVALDRLDAQFLTFGGGMAMTPEMAPRHADAVRLSEALAPFDNGRQYSNFAENPIDARSIFAEDRWTQLTGIRSAVDPHARRLRGEPPHPAPLRGRSAPGLTADRSRSARPGRPSSRSRRPGLEPRLKPISEAGDIASSTTPSGSCTR